jgi:hypothetical protein
MMELKHIAGYLPYKLKCRYADGLIIIMDSLPELFGEIHVGSNNSAYPLYTVKPILRPLSDLVNPCLEGGKIPIVEMAKICVSDHNWLITDGECVGMLNGEASYIFGYTKNGFWLTDISMNEDGSIEYTSCVIDNQLQLFEWLYQNHFDLHRLIEKNQAVDINLIEPK